MLPNRELIRFWGLNNGRKAVFLRPQGTHKQSDICGYVLVKGGFAVFGEVKTALKKMNTLEVE